MRNFIQWNIEAFLILIHFPSNFLKPVIPMDKINKNGENKHPVILVERWFTRNIFHYAAKKYLERKGFKVYSLNYPMMRGTFEEAALNLKKFIEDKNIEDVVLIGISGGATTCLDYLQNHEGWKETHLFISIGGSLYGSPLARALPISKSLRELIPTSKYMKHLHEKPVKNLDKIVTIRAKHDNMVPARYAQIEGVKNITVNVVGHNLLHTFYLPTYKLVADLAQN
jgi:hypothetical protein